MKYKNVLFCITYNNYNNPQRGGNMNKIIIEKIWDDKEDFISFDVTIDDGTNKNKINCITFKANIECFLNDITEFINYGDKEDVFFETDSSSKNNYQSLKLDFMQMRIGKPRLRYKMTFGQGMLGIENVLIDLDMKFIKKIKVAFEKIFDSNINTKFIIKE